MGSSFVQLHVPYKTPYMYNIYIEILLQTAVKYLVTTNYIYDRNQEILSFFKSGIKLYFLSLNQESRDIIFHQIRNQEILSFFKSGIKRYYLSSNQEILSFFKSGIRRYYLSSNQESGDIIFLQIRNQEILSFF